MVSTHVDSLEEVVTKAERDLDPSKIRKVFSSFPKLVSEPVATHYASMHSFVYTLYLG